MVAGNKIILGVAAVEAVGVGTVVATSAAVVNGLNAANSAAQSATLRAGAAVDLHVPGGVVAATQFVQGALRPSSAPRTTAGMLGFATNMAVRAVGVIKNLFF
jgi:hypothetical protein